MFFLLRKKTWVTYLQHCVGSRNVYTLYKNVSALMTHQECTKLLHCKEMKSRKLFYTFEGN